MTDKINEHPVYIYKDILKSRSESGQVIVDKRNAIHYENISLSLQKV